MTKESLGFVQEDIDNAKIYVSAIRARVERGQLTNEHLENAQSYLAGVESWRPHRPTPKIRTQPRIESGQRGLIGALHVGTAAGLGSKEDESKGSIELYFDSQKHSVRLEGETEASKITMELSNREFAIFTEFLQSPLRRVTSEHVTKLAKEQGSKAAFPARDAITPINRKFEKALGGEKLIQREGSSSRTLYRLNPKIGLVGDVTGEVEPGPVPITVKSVEEERVSIVDKYEYTIDLSSRMVRVYERSENAITEVVDHPDFDLLVKLLKSEDRVLSAQEVAEFCRLRGEKGLMLARQAVARLRTLVKDDLDDPQVIVITGKTKGAKYHLNGDFEIVTGFEGKEVKGSGRDRKNQYNAEVIELSSGETLEIVGPSRAKLIKKLAGLEKVNIKDLVVDLYGEDNEQNRERTYKLVYVVRDYLKDKGWQIKTSTEQDQNELETFYLLEKQEALVEKVIEVSAPKVIQQGATSDSLDSQVLSSPPQEGQDVDAAIVDSAPIPIPPERTLVPYLPSEDEKRSKQEDKVLSVVTSMIHGGGRITFEALQTALHAADRIGQDSIGPYVRGYPANEIIEKFESGFMKIREEAEISHLRQLWTEKDIEIWQNLQELLSAHGRNEAELMRKVKEEVKRAQRRFKRDNPDPDFDINKLRLR